MSKSTTQTILLVTAAVATLGALAYLNRDILFASDAQRGHEGALLTTIGLRLQEASHRAKKNYEPMTRKTIENIVWLESQQYGKTHGINIRVNIVFSSDKNNSAVKHLTLESPLTKTTIKLYYR